MQGIDLKALGTEYQERVRSLHPTCQVGGCQEVATRGVYIGTLSAISENEPPPTSLVDLCEAHWPLWREAVYHTIFAAATGASRKQTI